MSQAESLRALKIMNLITSDPENVLPGFLNLHLPGEILL
jgi:hypothetical protein